MLTHIHTHTFYVELYYYTDLPETHYATAVVIVQDVGDNPGVNITQYDSIVWIGIALVTL